MPGTIEDKAQPWKAHWPPAAKNTEGYAYPEAKKGETMIIDGRARGIMFKEAGDDEMAKKLIN